MRPLPPLLALLLIPATLARGDDPAPSPQAIVDHIRILASDDFEGRGPATPGEDRTVDYLVRQFQALGLKPGNPDGTYVQKVPLVGSLTRAEGSFQAGNETLPLKSADDWVAVSRHETQSVIVDKSPIIFVGYGVVAPEYGWDDYKGLDVKGKTLLMLVGDPPVPDPADPSRLDEKTFKGRAMTYYGRWTYKYEIAAEKGAAACIIIHETGPAGYPYEVVKGSWGRENFQIPTPDRNAGRAAIEAWVHLDKAKALLAPCGQDFESLKTRAVSREFQPVLLGAAFNGRIENTLRRVESQNVVARLEGSDPALRAETIVYTAHWDHLGKDTSLEGDQIYNGAADNASGVAMMLEIARAFTQLKPPPKRSVLFLAVTAEEKGLLGAQYYCKNPLYPLESTLANINMDVVNLWGPTSDVTSVGRGQTTLDDLLESLAARHGRSVGPDAEPEKGMYFRSDHFEFAKAGVPALNAKGGVDFIGKPAGYGKQKRDEYTQNDYHKPSDEVKPDWDLAGAAADALLLSEVGQAVAEGHHIPDWKPGSEFKARRAAARPETTATSQN
jgi:Zn-dependent M28 family amino/carboxypeptidase